jgi:hypothetical protein
MGRGELFDEENTFRKWMLAGNIIVRSMVGIDLIKKLYDKGYKMSEPFNKTLFNTSCHFFVSICFA